MAVGILRSQRNLSLHLTNLRYEYILFKIIIYRWIYHIWENYFLPNFSGWSRKGKVYEFRWVHKSKENSQELLLAYLNMRISTRLASEHVLSSCLKRESPLCIDSRVQLLLLWQYVHPLSFLFTLLSWPEFLLRHGLRILKGQFQSYKYLNHEGVFRKVLLCACLVLYFPLHLQVAQGHNTELD